MRPGASHICLFLILISFLNCKAGNESGVFPENCTGAGFEYRGDGVILNTEGQSSQSLYLLNNKSESDYWITHPVKDPGASAGWTSDINPGNWSAFTVNIPDFELTCMKTGQSSMETLDCEKVLKVCRITNPVFKPDMSGNYWVSEDKPLGAVLDEIRSRGIEW
ncbi:MAG: hypothetical protein AB1598_07405 [Thermodesulfobacteriota bacterium]